MVPWSTLAQKRQHTVQQDSEQSLYDRWRDIHTHKHSFPFHGVGDASNPNTLPRNSPATEPSERGFFNDLFARAPDGTRCVTRCAALDAQQKKMGGGLVGGVAQSVIHFADRVDGFTRARVRRP